MLSLSRIIQFFHQRPALTTRQWRVLGLAALAAIFGAYSIAILSLALPQIQTTFALSATHTSNLAAILKLGSLPAFPFALAADRWGRRRLLIFAVAAFSLLNGATALAPTPTIFIGLQFGARLFITVAGILASVVIVEEFPAEARGWGIGAYVALASVGGGVAALFFALVNVAPFGWRTLYLLSFCALGCLGLWRRHLPETERFQVYQSRQSAQSAHPGQPLLLLVRAYPGRFVTLSAIIFLFNLGGDAALFYDPAYLQQAHGWQPWQITALNLGAGFMALVGSMSAGRLSDRWGRKPATTSYLALMPLLIIAYYHSWGWLLPLCWAGMLFASIGAGVALGALSTELFPTSYRSTASGAIALVATVGGALSLAVHGLLVAYSSTPWIAVSLLASLILATPALVPFLPETSGRALEEIAPERV